jgi:hypothetical protein
MAKWYKIASITTAGSAGSATGDSGVVSKDIDNNVGIPSGLIVGVFIDFTSQPATCDVTVSRVLPNAALQTLVVTTDVNADRVMQIKEASYSTAGVVSATDLVYPWSINGQFKTTVAQGDAITNGVVVWVAIE